MQLKPHLPSCIIATILSFSFQASVLRAENQETTGTPHNARPVKVMQLDIGRGDRERELPGEVRASDKAALSFRIAGQISHIYVRPGQHVKAGDLLAELDSDLYQQQFEVAKAQYELAKVLFERSGSLVERGVVSRNDHDQSKSDYTIASAALDKATSNLTYTQLKAPYDGVISKRDHRAFEFVLAQEPVLGIRTESYVDVGFQLPEQFIGAIEQQKISQTATGNIKVKFDSREQWYPATLKEMTTLADSTIGSYTIIITLPMPDKLNVLPGMAALVKVSLPSRGIRLNPKIPAGAILQKNGQSFAFKWLPSEEKVQEVAVMLDNGRLIGGMVDGEWLVVAGASELMDGDRAVRWVKERGL